MAKSDAEIIAKANKILADAIQEQTRALKYTNALLRKLIVEGKSPEKVSEEMMEEEPEPNDVVRERIRSVANSMSKIAESMDNIPTAPKDSTDA